MSVDCPLWKGGFITTFSNLSGRPVATSCQWNWQRGSVRFFRAQSSARASASNRCTSFKSGFFSSAIRDRKPQPAPRSATRPRRFFGRCSASSAEPGSMWSALKIPASTVKPSTSRKAPSCRHSASSAASQSPSFTAWKTRHLCFCSETIFPAARSSSFSNRCAPARFAIATTSVPPFSNKSYAFAKAASASSRDFPGSSITTGQLPAGVSTRPWPACSHSTASGLKGCHPVTCGHSSNAGCTSAPRNSARGGIAISPRSNGINKVSKAGLTPRTMHRHRPACEA